MTPLAQETRRLLAAVQQKGYRIEVPPRVPPSSFKSTPGPKQGVDYRSPYWPHRKHTVAPLSLKAQGLKVEAGKLTPARKEDGLMILAPVTPRPTAYIGDQEKRSKEYFARKEKGLCAKCDQPGVIKKDGKRAAFCEGHLAEAAAYRQGRREEG